jgi:hypothetical protein
MPILVNKYETRLKDFLYRMAQSPKKIKDHNIAVTSTRKELLDEENHKILAGKGFVLKHFKTEKQRLQEQLSTKEALELRENILNLIPEGSELRNIQQLSKTNVDNILKLKAFYDKKKKHLNSSKINQPNMRFTAKNNLERIFDALNIYSYGRIDKNELERKKKQLETKKKMKNNELNSDDDDDEDDSLENVDMKEKENEESLNKNNNIRGKRNGKKINKIDDKKIMQKHDHNSQARHILSELHEKTHFKGASGFTLWKSTSLLKNTNDKAENKNEENKTNSKLKDTSWEKFQLRRLNSQISNINDNSSNNKNNYMMSNFTKHKVQYEMNWTSDTKNNNRDSNNLINYRSNTVENSNRLEDYFNNVNDSFNHNYLLNKLDIEEDLAQSNPLLYNLSLNTYKKKYENRDETDSKKLNYLKKLAFDADLNKERKNEKMGIGYLKKLIDKNDKKKGTNKMSLLQTDPVAFFEKYKENIEGNDFTKPNNLESKKYFFILLP